MLKSPKKDIKDPTSYRHITKYILILYADDVMLFALHCALTYTVF